MAEKKLRTQYRKQEANAKRYTTLQERMMKNTSDTKNLRKRADKLMKKMPELGKMAKPRPAKSLARKLVGKVGAKAIPGVGGAMIAYDVMKAGAKKRCVEKGGKVKGNRCFMPKKTRAKVTGADPRFSRTRGRK